MVLVCFFLSFLKTISLLVDAYTIHLRFDTFTFSLNYFHRASNRLTMRNQLINFRNNNVNTTRTQKSTKRTTFSLGRNSNEERKVEIPNSEREKNVSAQKSMRAFVACKQNASKSTLLLCFCKYLNFIIYILSVCSHRNAKRTVSWCASMHSTVFVCIASKRIKWRLLIHVTTSNLNRLRLPSQS